MVGSGDAAGGVNPWQAQRAARRRELEAEQMRLSASSAGGDVLRRIAVAARKGVGVRLSPEEAECLRRYHLAVAEEFPPDEFFNAEAPGT